MARAPLTKEEIQRINNLGDVFNLLTLHGIPLESFSATDVKSAKRLLTAKYHEQSGTKMRKPGDGTVMMAEALEVDRERRKELLGYLSNIQRFLTSLEPDVIKQLDMRCKGSVLSDCADQLKKDDCPILVAGETSAGKSTLLNVLLGEPLLPTSVLSTTSIICELKYGETKRAVFHKKGPATHSKLEVMLDGSAEENKKKLSDKVHLEGEHRETSPDYDKVEIFWPLLLLKGGIFIVDSPGVGESKMMDAMVSQYIGQACAFIYVLNSTNGGGVQPGKLQTLLDHCRNKHPDQMELFDPKTAIFVCNKWDQVPEKEREKVRGEIIKKLEEHWSKDHKLDSQSQVFCLSATEAEKAQEVGHVAEDLKQLLDGIDALLLQSLQHKLAMQLCSVKNVAKELHNILKAQLHNAEKTKEQREEKARSVRARLEKFDEDATEVMHGLTKKLQNKMARAFTDIVACLYIDNTVSDIVKEAMERAPTLTKEEEKNWKEVQSTAEKLVSDLIVKKVHTWDSSIMYFETVESNLVKTFKEEFHLIEERHHEEIQRALDPDLLSFTVQMREVTGDDGFQGFPPFTTAQKIAFGVTAPIWIPFALVSVVLGMPVLAIAAAKHVIEEKLEKRRFIKIYCNKETKSKHFEDLISKGLDGLSENKEVISLVQTRLTKTSIILKRLKEAIPNLVAADKNLLDILAAESRGQDLLLSLYQPLVQECKTLQSELEFFEMKYLTKHRFNLDHILKECTKELGSGTFGDVYEVNITIDGETFAAAIKVVKEPITVDNVILFHQEKNNLRYLKHDNVLKYYGTAAAINGGCVRVGIVTELCHGTLLEWLSHLQEKTPAKWQCESEMYERAFLNIKEMGIQLCWGLSYIHMEGYIHRDLKADNILVTKAGVVKLADLALTKKMVDQTGTVCGTPVYAAPEVFTEKPDYNQKADIYSLGFVLLEMWYGIPVYEDPQFLKKVKDKGDLPAQLCLLGLLPPIEPWQKLIKNCLKRDKELRPTAVLCMTEIEVMKL